MGLQISNAFAPGITIKSGISPTGSYNILSNGILDIAKYSSINVDIKDLLDIRLQSTLSISSYENYNITHIAPFAFAGQYISAINLPNVITIGQGAFYDTKYLSSINFPKCTFIASNAFSPCPSLTTVILPNLENLLSGTFTNCYKLTSVDLAKCKILGYQALYGCSSLTTVNVPQCISTNYCTFAYCLSLSSIALPNCQYLSQYTFGWCRNLHTVELGSQCSYIGFSAFAGCYNLLSLYLNVTSVPVINGTGAFSSTPISNYTTSTGGVYGKIYVPSSLYAAFITANTWSTYSARMVSM